MKRLAALLLVVHFACSSTSASETPASTPPRLVVFISVDQLKGDIYDKFAPLFRSGLARLRMEGLHCTNADLNYAPSETGPGHATMATATYPGKSGIVSNDWYDTSAQRDVYCVEDSTAESSELGGGAVSPRNLRTPALGDWIKAASPRSKVVSVSLKDRAAILMGGKHPDVALWYNSATGQFGTSEYYTERLPHWVSEFNAKRWVETRLPAAWTRMLVDSFYTRFGPDELAGEYVWDGNTSFPHPFDPHQRTEQVRMTPYGNEILFDLARTAIEAEGLGSDDVVDLLNLSLSATDYVGHAFGPDSHEMIDNLVRLDIQLGEFISYLETRFGRERIFIALTADHAAIPLPEYTVHVEKGQAHRLRSDIVLNPAIKAADDQLMAEFKTSEHILIQRAFLNYRAAAKAGVSEGQLHRMVREKLTAIDGIDEVYFRSDMLAKKQLPETGEYFRRGYGFDRGQDFLLVFDENTLVTSAPTGTSHGSPHRYDTHIPVLFWGPTFPTNVLSRRVNLVDVAPTIAGYLKIAPPTAIDGVAIPEALTR